ncbi:MAG: hypothetical protein SVR94_12885 [Pseudomonadota bacterium]|nr:hypothetical protein [Pseudomonadota bacterium]
MALKNRAETLYPIQSFDEEGDTPRTGHNADEYHTRICLANGTPPVRLEMSSKLTQQIDFAIIESELNQEYAQLNAVLQQAMLQALLREEHFLKVLKTYAGRRGMRLKAYRSIMLTPMPHSATTRPCLPCWNAIGATCR